MFFSHLQSLGKVYAPVPVSAKSFSFKQVTSPDEIAFDALRSILPPKKFFYPQEETIMSWRDGEFKEELPEPEFQVIFGIHPCDLAGLFVMDTIYQAAPADSHYTRKREASLLVGLSCLPDKHCFCQSMGNSCPDGNYDLFLTDLGNVFFLEIRSPAGLKFVSSLPEQLPDAGDDEKVRYKEFWSMRSQMFQNSFEPDNLHSLLDMEWNNKIWQDLGERCLSCGNCTPVCPTCYCFDLVDIAQLNGQEGERKRQWDSCQFVGFAKVAGEFNFRPTPVDRLKFWYRHKLHGFDDPYGFRTCVGCGRCTESCPAGIDDLVQVVQVLQGKKAGYQPQHQTSSSCCEQDDSLQRQK